MGGARQGLTPENGIGGDLGTMNGGRGTFWVVLENLSGEKVKCAETGEAQGNKLVWRGDGRLEPAG